MRSMTETNKLGLGPAIGRRVREIRESRGLRQEEMSQRLQAFGVNWNRSMTAKVERGERGVTLEEAVLLTYALDVPLSELVPADGKVDLTAQARRVPLATVRDVLAGGHRWDIDYGDLPIGRALRADLESYPERLKLCRRIWPDAQASDFANAQGGIGEAEGKAAKRLGVEPVVVSVAAFKTWGRSLTAERDIRAAKEGEGMSPASRRAHRGQITRQLVAELAQVIKEAQP